MNYFFIIAHTPLANALRDCVLHVFPDTSEYIVALDILPNSAPQDALHTAQLSIKQLFALPKTTRPNGIVVFTDLFGATPSNIATELVDGTHVKLVAGVNLPMLLKAVSYRHESIDSVVSRAITGGIQGVMSVAVTPQQHQKMKSYDQGQYNHQQ